MPHEFKEDTLDDIKHRDVFNLETVLSKKGRKYETFELREAALRFTGKELALRMAYLGISLERASKDKTYDIDAEMERRKIKVENRVYEEAADEWRSGMYIYSANEIAGFVGHPIYEEDDFKGYRVLCTEKM